MEDEKSKRISTRNDAVETLATVTRIRRRPPADGVEALNGSTDTHGKRYRTGALRLALVADKEVAKEDARK